MLCCVVLEASWITAATVDEVLALPRGGFGFRPLEKVNPKAATKNWMLISIRGHVSRRACGLWAKLAGVEWKYDR